MWGKANNKISSTYPKTGRSYSAKAFLIFPKQHHYSQFAQAFRNILQYILRGLIRSLFVKMLLKNTVMSVVLVVLPTIFANPFANPVNSPAHARGSPHNTHGGKLMKRHFYCNGGMYSQTVFMLELTLPSRFRLHLPCGRGYGPNG